ncbi:hypothetical protein BDR07DRAFT_1492768 [Suillus spraguei]|nr:hypothetical protein BDR07DRAFT_1492768 [Suillus spraguei]
MPSIFDDDLVHLYLPLSVFTCLRPFVLAFFCLDLPSSVWTCLCLSGLVFVRLDCRDDRRANGEKRVYKNKNYISVSLKELRRFYATALDFIGLASVSALHPIGFFRLALEPRSSVWTCLCLSGLALVHLESP